MITNTDTIAAQVKTELLARPLAETGGSFAISSNELTTPSATCLLTILVRNNSAHERFKMPKHASKTAMPRQSTDLRQKGRPQ
ncbi:hypothetical protein [Pararhizobium sp. O133]|uniref:hypothetical protein n=1 Tax=Pararhizobium sp. O133 TaxID=3449278 RepID=UPI003F686CB0